jgi:hypothetical protein
MRHECTNCSQELLNIHVVISNTMLQLRIAEAIQYRSLDPVFLGMGLGFRFPECGSGYLIINSATEKSLDAT